MLDQWPQRSGGASGTSTLIRGPDGDVERPVLFLLRGNASVRCAPGDAHPGPPSALTPRSLRLGFLIIQIDVLRSAPLRHASLAVTLSKKSFFNLSVDAMQPLLRSVGFLSISIGFCF